MRDRSVVVLGLGASGRAAATLLRGLGAVVVPVEDAPSADTVGWAQRTLQTIPVTPDAVDVRSTHLLVLSPGIPTRHRLVQQAQAAGVPVWSEIELAYRFSTAPVIAITGSKGKSTTAALLGHLWNAVGRSGVVAGNIGVAYSTVVPRLQESDWVVLEVSSFQLETVDAFHPRVAVHLPVTPDHLDRYAGMEEYAAAKARLVRHLNAADLLVLDPSDPWSARLLDRTAARGVGIARTVDGRGVVQHRQDLVWEEDGHLRQLCSVDDLPLVGRHNVHNVMAALAVLCGLGAWTPAGVAALRTFRGLEFRMQPCGTIQGVRFLNDSKSTTVESVRAAVSGLDEPLILAMGGRNKGLDFKPLRDTLQHVRRLLVFGEAASEIEAALQDAVDVERVADLDEVVRRSLVVARPGDTVLFSPGCTSFDMFDNAEARGRAFTAVVEREREVRGS